SGIIREVGKRIFNIDVKLTVTGRTQRSVHMASGEKIEEHVVFLIEFQNDETGDKLRAYSTGSIPSMIDSEHGELRISPIEMCSILPYHLILDEDCKIMQAGVQLWYDF
ncbi:hypothetical protein AB6A40_010690, partial [Gnathostoma spinigerum]